MTEGKSSHKTTIIVIIAVVSIVIAFVIGYWIGFTPSTKPEQKQLTIASFEKEVMGDLSSYLNLVIDNYWVEGNKVRVTGTVNWLGGFSSRYSPNRQGCVTGTVNWLGGEYAVSNTAVTMYITEAGTNSVNLKVVVYGGGLLVPKPGTIDSDTVEIPTLGIDVFSFDFSLTCVYE